MKILEIEDLHIYFPIRRGLFGRIVDYIKAVEGVSLSVVQGDGVAIVGETGSGKTTILKAILKLVKPSKGRILFEGKDIFRLSREEEAWYRRNVQIVFQNPYQSLNPRMSVYSILAEPLKKYGKLGDKKLRERIEELLQLVGLPISIAKSYPPNLSGGQAQRVAIARAIAVNPKLLILDEPTSALDVSIQAQIINLLQELKHRLGVTYLLVTHDLSIVSYLVKNIAVIYRGNLMEFGYIEDVIRNPLHPYTKVLTSSIPEPLPNSKKNKVFKPLEEDGVEVAGCRFAKRCPYAKDLCFKEKPSIQKIENRLISCWLYQI